MKKTTVVLLPFLAMVFACVLPSCEESKGPGERIGESIDDATDSRPAEGVKDAVEDAADAVQDAVN